MLMREFTHVYAHDMCIHVKLRVHDCAIIQVFMSIWSYHVYIITAETVCVLNKNHASPVYHVCVNFGRDLVSG